MVENHEKGEAVGSVEFDILEVEIIGESEVEK